MACTHRLPVSDDRRIVRASLVVLAVLCLTLGAEAQDPTPGQSRADRRAQQRLEEEQRRELEMLLGLADNAMAGRPVSADFRISWRNDFFKARPGTFVPFTVTIDRAGLSAATALLYLRVVAKGTPPVSGAKTKTYAFDAVFPVELNAESGQPLRITRGFAVEPGEYDVYVVLRERQEGPGTGRPPKAAVLKQPLEIPDFWGPGLAVSTIMLATGIDDLAAPLSPDDLLEQPYVVGRQAIRMAPDRVFRRDRELIVVFLIYNPSVASGGQFDIQVDYYLYRRGSGTVEAKAGDHPPARAGEEYLSRTAPQRFNLDTMGGVYDAGAGQPVMAGQGIPLSSFRPGEYRIGITVTDLLSRQALSRDVAFTVVGS